MSPKKTKNRRAATENPPVAAQAPESAPEPLTRTSFWRLRIFVFIAGITLMAFEIAGSRILAPHFGNSIFTWGSLITVFMVALAGGYFVGGRLADRHPHTLGLAVIGLLAALLIAIVPAAGRMVCESIARVDYGRRASPFMAAMFLFFPASVLLGMVSPYAVRIASSDLSKVGKTAGTLYALSTLGNIIGTILTAFFLIPALGVKHIVLSLAVMLMLTSLLLVTAPRRRVLPLVLICLVVTGGAFALPQHAYHRGELIFYEQSHYQDVTVDEQNGCRFLYFDRYKESGIYLEPPYDTACGYTDMLHLGLLFPREHESFLFVGGGGGVGPRRFRRDFPDAQIDVVEIDPVVVEVSKRFFEFEEDENMHVWVADGRMFLKRHEDRTYDLIVLDAYGIHGQVPFHLMTREFFELCRSRLRPGGAVLMNFITAVRGREARLFHAEMKTLQTVFPNIYVFPRGYPGSDLTDPANVMIVACTREETLSGEDILDRAVRMVEDKQITIPRFTIIADSYMPYVFDPEKNPQFAGAPVISDDFAPVELLQPNW